MHWYTIVILLLVSHGAVAFVFTKYGRILEARAQADLNAMRNRISGAVSGGVKGFTKS